jgi:hypothetical protein
MLLSFGEKEKHKYTISDSHSDFKLFYMSEQSITGAIVAPTS